MAVTTDNGANVVPNPSGALTPNQVRAIAYQAGFRGQGLNTAVQVAGAESARIPTNRYAPGPQEDSRGLWQINIAPTANPRYASANLYNPLVNARIAYAMSQGGKNWSPWTTYTSGKYLHEPTGTGIGAGMASGSLGATPGQGGGIGTGPSGSAGSISRTVTGFNQAGFQAAQAKAIAGRYLANVTDPYKIPLPSTGLPQGGLSTGLPAGPRSNPLLTLGVLPTAMPNPANFQTQHTVTTHLAAHAALQNMAGNSTTLTAHPATGLHVVGVTNYDAHPVAKWIVPILQYAAAHGWTGTVSSGYRSYAQQKAIYDSGVRPAAVPGTSNHEGNAYPRGAVDVTDASQLSAILERSPYASVLVWAGGKDPVHFSHPHDGHY